MIRAINVKASPKGRVRVGLLKDEFIAELQSLPANDRGYVNLDLIPNNAPTAKGYTHRVMLSLELKNEANGDIQNK